MTVKSTFYSELARLEAEVERLRTELAQKDEEVARLKAYVQHKADCDVLTKRAEYVTCPHCAGTGRAIEGKHQMRRADGTPWPENNCAPCAGSRNHEWLKYPSCSCGLEPTPLQEPTK